MNKDYEEPEDNIEEVYTEVCKFCDYKNVLINFLNKHPLLACNQFKKIAYEYFGESAKKESSSPDVRTLSGCLGQPARTSGHGYTNMHYILIIILFFYLFNSFLIFKITVFDGF